jgi:glycosyltransferase involved in cell wall biosynthesis
MRGSGAARGPKRMGFNMMFLDSSALSGPGYYAVQVFSEMTTLVRSRSNLTLVGFIQEGALAHFPQHCHSALRVVGNRRGGRLGRVAWEQLVLPIHVRRDRVDLLFSPGFVSPLWGSRALVACIHDMYYAVIPNLIDQAQRRYWQIFVRLTAWRCQRLIAVSTQTAADLIHHLPVARGKVRVTKLASRLQPTSDAIAAAVEHPFILMVANLTANKNVETVLAALDMVRSAGHDLRLVHVGRDPDKRLSHTSKRADVVALGKVSDSVLMGLYQGAVAVVNASFYEGFGMPAVEAQAMGAALISSNHAALVEAAGSRGALFYDARQPSQLAAHIIDVMTRPDHRKQLVRHGRENAASLSWKATAEQTLMIFEELLT